MKCQRIGRAVFLLSPTVCHLARRGHGGDDQMRRDVRRQVLAEQRVHGDRVAGNEGTSVTISGTSQPANSAQLLAEVHQNIERTRASLHGRATSPVSLDSKLPSLDSGSSDPVPSVVSLSQFITECKRLRVDIGFSKSKEERHRARECLRRFWNEHAGNAVLCCHVLGEREFAFIATHGLSDDALHIPFSAQLRTIEVLARRRDSTSRTDMTQSLLYLLKELRHGSHAVDRGDTNSKDGTGPTAADWDALRTALTDLSLERIYFLFLRHGPSAGSGDGVVSALSDPMEEAGSHEGYPNEPRRKAFFTFADDCLTALEILSLLDIKDCTPAVATTLERRIQEAERRYREQLTSNKSSSNSNNNNSSGFLSSSSSSSSSSSPQTPPPPPFLNKIAPEEMKMTTGFIATRLLKLAVQQRSQLKMTSVVQCFALLRIFLPELWPPYKLPPQRALDSGKGKSSPPAAAQDLAEERDALMRIAWGLALALHGRDARFTNSYHFVKILSTLARLPAFTLAQTRSGSGDRRRQFQYPNRGGPGHSSSSTGGTPPAMTPSKPVVMSPADFWRFIVTKACIFVPSLPTPARRTVCLQLQIAIKEKRGAFLGSPKPTSRGGRQGSLQADSSPVVTADAWSAAAMAPNGSRSQVLDLDDSADDILLPLIEEMRDFDEDFHAAVRAARATPSPHRHRGGGRRGSGGNGVPSRHRHQRQRTPRSSQ